jgi:hypothetical protein
MNTDFWGANVHTIGGITCKNCGDPQDTPALPSKMHSISSTQCSICDTPCHDKPDCQIYVNGVLIAHFAKEDPSAAVKVLCDHKKLMRIYKGRATPNIHQIVEEPIYPSDDLDSDHPAHCTGYAAMVNAMAVAKINSVHTDATLDPNDDDSRADSDYSDIGIPPMLLRHICEYESYHSDDVSSIESITPAMMSIIAANWNE